MIILLGKDDPLRNYNSKLTEYQLDVSTYQKQKRIQVETEHFCSFESHVTI